MTRLSKSLLVAAFLVAMPACAGRNKVSTNPDAPLGRVIIYRNGVAYFERNAVVDEQLSLRVPRARVDDFLKSLTVTDVETGKPLPISYPTTREAESSPWVEMTIALPPGRREVKIAYVTESPAWKPSYRVILEDEGQARLQSWAIVDNVSGERWDKVKVGVGSTSALSFRYDLHSVKMVERETLDTNTLLAQAPPRGGSPYSVDGNEVRVLANLSSDDLVAAPTIAGSTGAESQYQRSGEDFRNLPVGSSTDRDFAQVVEVSPSAARDSAGISLGGVLDEEKTTGRTVSMEEWRPINTGVDGLRAELAANDTRIRIEGYALAGEADPEIAGLRRANTLREQLVAGGIASERIDVVAGAHVVESPHEVVKVVAVDESTTFTEAVLDDVDPDSPRGTAHFVSEKSMSIDQGHSAMVTLFDQQTEAQRVYLYDPISSRGSKRFAFNAVRVQNPSDNTLDSGPITVYARGRFLGEGLTEPVPPHEAALVPYALDRTLVVEPTVDTEEQVERLVTVERGIATTQTRRTRRTRLKIDNRGHADARVYVRHHVASGWTLQEPPQDLEHLGQDILIPISVAAGSRHELVLEETMPVTTALDLRSARGLEQIAVYLEVQGVAAPSLREQLQAIVETYRKLSTVDDKLATRHEQMSVLRERVEELSSQLRGLRKVKRAQQLSGHLAERMEQLGDKLDDLTVEVTELETDRLKARIALQNMVAELTLVDEGETAGGTANASP